MRALAAKEHDEQSALFRWAFFAMAKHHELSLLYAIPNGGHRHKAVAKRMKAEGVRAGVPDLCLPVPRNGYHGLYVEMKAGRGRPTHQQQRWIDALACQGYKAVVCYGWQHAKNVIEEYLDSGPNGLDQPQAGVMEPAQAYASAGNWKLVARQ